MLAAFHALYGPVMYHLVADEPAFLVVHKAPDVSFHSESGEIGLFETVRQRENLAQLFPVHRLDKVTSGLLVMAKTPEANAVLCNAFASRQVEKYYLALSAKKPIKKQGLVCGDMAPSRRGAWKLVSSTINPAVTQFFSRGCEGKRLFIVKPHTGKTHQIRVALKSVGAPIWGDSLYGGDQRSHNEVADRCYLHAYSIGFELAGQFYRYTEMPIHGSAFKDSYVAETITAYREPWALSWPSVGRKG